MFELFLGKIVVLSVLDTNAALLMHSEFILKKINIKGYNIRVDGEKYHYSTRSFTSSY